MNILEEQASNRRALSIDEIIYLSLRILGGSTYIDACWGLMHVATSYIHI